MYKETSSELFLEVFWSGVVVVNQKKQCQAFRTGSSVYKKDAVPCVLWQAVSRLYDHRDVILRGLVGDYGMEFVMLDSGEWQSGT